MQRVRVGLTGLGAVLLIVAISAAIFESARNQPAADRAAPLNTTERTVANIVAANTAAAPADPLTEIGVTPAAPNAVATAAPAPAR